MDLTGYKKVVPESDYVIFENIGQDINGIYHKKEPNAGQFGQHRYTLLVKEKGKEVPKYILGTVVLDRLFDEVSYGDCLYIKLVDKKKQPGKSDLKLFEMYVKENQNKTDFIDDPEAQAEIEHIKELIGNHNVSSEEIADYAKKHQKELDYSANDLTKVLKQAAKMNREGK